MALQTQFISTFQQGHTLSTLFYSIPLFNLSHIKTKFSPQKSCFPLFSLFLQPSFIKIPSSMKNLAPTWLISSTEHLLQYLLKMWTVRSFVKYSASLSNTGSMTVVLVAGGRLANITRGVHTGFESTGQQSGNRAIGHRQKIQQKTFKIPIDFSTTILTPDVIHYQMCSSQQSPQLVLGSFTALASHHQPARAGILPVQTSANTLRISCLALRCLWERELGGLRSSKH